eukprot:1087604-Alexandrium_andersonii.AAC.1
MIRASARSNESSLLLDLDPGLADQTIQGFLSDFRQGVAHIAAIAEQKLAVWLVLPWQLFGLGHWDVQRARAVAARCLSLFDEHKDMGVPFHHPLTLKFLSPACALRSL